MEGNPILDGITWIATHFIGLFNAAGTTLMALITGILPLLIVLLTAMYAITTWIGEERVTRAVQWAGRWQVTRYTIMPIIAVIMLTNPMCYSFGRFLPERFKPAFYDSAVSFVHPVTAFFPHANAGEIFVWTGVSAGVLAINPGAYARLAALYFLVGIVVILIRGVVTQWITQLLINRGGHQDKFAEFDAAYEAGHLQGSNGHELPGSEHYEGPGRLGCGADPRTHRGEERRLVRDRRWHSPGCGQDRRAQRGRSRRRLHQPGAGRQGHVCGDQLWRHRSHRCLPAQADPHG